MSIHDLKQKYGKSKKSRQLYNTAIRVECPGGSELLDLLELVNHMRQRAHGETAQILKVVEDRLQQSRLGMFEYIRKKYRVDEPKPTQPIPVSLGIGQYGEEWTNQEIAILEKYYNKGKGIDKCVEMLPGRNRGGIIEQARKSGFATRKARYTPLENEAILRGDFDALPGRSINALKIQKSRLLKGK